MLFFLRTGSAFRAAVLSEGKLRPAWTAHTAADPSALRAEAELPEHPAVLVLPSSDGFVEDGVLTWLREHPREPFTLAEGKTVLRELTTRAAEDARRMSPERGTAALIRTDMRNILIDGRRILNPVGFPGRSIVFSATHTFLNREGERALRLVYEAFPVEIYPMLRDQLVFRAVSAHDNPDIVVILDQEDTTVLHAHDGAVRRRTVLAVGLNSAQTFLLRALRLDSPAESSRLLEASASGQLSASLERRVDRALAPFLLRWAALVTEAIGSAVPTRGRANFSLLAIDRWQPPFRDITAPKVLRRLFPTFRSAAWTSGTLREFCAAPDEATGDDVLVLAASRAEKPQSSLTWPQLISSS